MSETFYAYKLPPGTTIVIDGDYRGIIYIGAKGAHAESWEKVGLPSWQGDTPMLESVPSQRTTE